MKVGDGSTGQFAVKITDLKGRQDDTRERIARQEVHILKRVGDQEHCCRLIDSMFCRRFHYIVLDRCSLPLVAALEGVPELTELTLAKFVRQMFKALACVHSVDVVHRDVKPDNFLCSGPEATVKLCDFGLAEVVRAGSPGVTGRFGTAPFMSPEMIQGSVYGTPTDVWSLGVILYTLVVGQFPYVPERACVKLMKAAIASGVPEPSFQCVVQGSELSSQVLGLLQSLIDRDAKERPSAAEALEHCWFSPELDEAQRPQHSLKETLRAAQRVGAFSMQCSAGEAPGRTPDSMDLALRELQRRYWLQYGPNPAGEKGEDEDFYKMASRARTHDSASTVDTSPSAASTVDKAFSAASTVDKLPSASSSLTLSRVRPYGIIIRT
jgi:serine/threonine protein kinase